MTRTTADEIARLLAELHGIRHMILAVGEMPPGARRYIVARIEDAEATAERARAALTAADADRERAWIAAHPPLGTTDSPLPAGALSLHTLGRASW